MSDLSSDNDADFRDDEIEHHPLRMLMAIALLREGRQMHHLREHRVTPDLVKEPCPNTMYESDFRQAVLRNQGITNFCKSSKHNNIAYRLSQREVNCCSTFRNQPFSQAVCTQISTHYIPNKAIEELRFDEKNFCGVYSADGKMFLSACQDNHIRIYDSSTFGQTKPFKDITAKNVGWSVLDVAFSPDARSFAYSSWSHYIHLCTIFDEDNPSLLKHEALLLDPDPHSFAVFSLQFAKDCNEIVCGTNEGYIYVYNLEANERVFKVDAHEDDVNAICFADDRSHIVYSGGDDGLVKVWDRRMLSNTCTTPVGCLAGHQDGITFIDSIGDARYLLSNSKDQSIKLWDIRRFSSEDAINNVKQVVRGQAWDYRWENVPRQVHRRNKLTVAGDTSVCTYSGHTVLNTLIRARFSPLHSTGNKYIYTGCSTGRVFIYDVLTGEVVSQLKGHHKCVRDVSWHPYQQSIISSSWEGRVKLWEWQNLNI